MVLIERGPMESYDGLLLLTVGFAPRKCLYPSTRVFCGLVVDLCTLGLHHHSASVDAFDFGHKLFL